MINDKIHQVVANIKRSFEEPNLMENIGKSEKIVSVGAGAFILLKGISNVFSHPLLAVTELAVGGGLLYRGLTGYCPIKDMAEQDDNLYVRETIVEIEPLP